MRKTKKARFRRFAAIVLIAFIVICQISSLGFGSLTVVRAQSCDVTVNVAVGTGTTCVNFYSTLATYSSAADPGDPAVFGQTVYLQFLTSPNTCVTISVQSESGWTSGTSGHLNNLSWDCSDSAVATFDGTESTFHSGNILGRHQFMWASPTAFSVTVRLLPLSGTPSTPCTTSWSVTHDFTQQEKFSWEPVAELGALAKVDGDGYNGAIAEVPGDHTKVANYLTVERSIPSTSVTSIDLDVDYSPGTPGIADLRQIIVSSGSTTLVDAGSPPPGGRHTYHWSGSQIGGTFQISVYSTGTETTIDPFSMPVGSLAVKSITMTGTGVNPDGVCVPSSIGGSGTTSDWAYPVALKDQNATNPVRYIGADNPVMTPFSPLAADLPSGTDRTKIGLEIYSNHSDAYVHSMTDGTVESITFLTSGTDVCDETSVLTNISAGPSYTCEHEDPVGTLFAVGFQNAALVTVQLDTGSINYIVANPEVQQGQTVTAGCILGKTLAFYVVKIGFSPLPVVSYQISTDGYALVQARDGDGKPFDILPYLKVDPLDKHCTQSAPNSSGCKLVNNPGFEAPASEWSPLSSDNTALNPIGQTSGLVLIGGVRQSLILDSSLNYVITIKSHLLNPVNDIVVDFSVQLGSSAAAIVPVTNLAPETYVVPAATYTPSLSPDQYDLVIKSTANTRSNVVVDFICVADSTAAPVAPTDCLVYNPDINDSSHWTPSGSVDFSGGLANLPDGTSIQQDVTLFPQPSSAQNYTLTVDARRKGTPVSGQSVILSWSYDGSSPTSMGTFSDQITETKTATFDVSTTTTAALVLSSSSTPDQTLQIDRVCIKTSDGVSPPGYQPIDPTASCKVCTYSPVGDVNVDLPEMITWLECALSQIWFCQMKAILVGIWYAVVNILTFLGMMRLWFQYAFQAGATLLNADLLIVARWGNAQFVNLANQLTDAIRYGPISSTQITNSTGANFFDAVIALVHAIDSIAGNIISGLQTVFNDLRDVILTLITSVVGLATFVFGLVGGIITLIINGVFTLIFTILNLISSLIAAIIAAASVAPVAPAGIPMCDTSASLIPQSCLSIFMIDNTIFADGSLIGTVLPLFEGAAALGLVWWAIIRFRNAIAGLE